MATLSPRRASDAPQGGVDMENPEFLRLLDLVENTSASIFLTGRAGTGKSTFLRYIIEHTQKNCAVLAPTGIAAVNVGGQTLHSFFHLPLQPVLPEDPDFVPGRLRDRLELTPKTIKTFRATELIIIDEISMVRADVLDLVDRILRTFGGDRRKPFGGKQLLLVGDVFQLEPVVTKEDKPILDISYPNAFFFSARVFAECGLASIELKKIYRQKEPVFLSILERVRNGCPAISDINALNSRHAKRPEGEHGPSDIVMTLAGRRATVKAINDQHLQALAGEAITYTGTVTGEFPPTSFPTDMELTLKEGAQVMFLRNDPEHRFVNGTIGIVLTANAEKLTVQLEDGNEIDVEPAEWSNVSYEYDSKTKRVAANVKGTFVQFPIKTAWALTIHKSQGLTFDRVVIDLTGGAFAGGQVYVALSRCTSLGGIGLTTPIDPRDVYVHPEVIRFSRTFNDLEQQQLLKAREQVDALLTRAAKAFNAGDFNVAVESFNEALRCDPHLNTPALRRYIAIKLASLNKKSPNAASGKQHLYLS